MASARNGRPWIGITSYARTGRRDSLGLPGAYVDAVWEAGGLPVILPPVDAEPGDVLERIDGLVLPGGGDIAPQRYRGKPHDKIYGVSEERDHFEITLLRAALARRDKPLLCICRGLQVLNVVLGGTLHPHLPDLGEGIVSHRDSESAPTRHPVSVEPASRLAAILGTTEILVASFHHQAIDGLGEGLRAVAWARDGVIEAVEHESHPFCIGVQWHPELQRDEPAERRLLRAFVESCSDSREGVRREARSAAAAR
jgi:putative glutamine amidotransferase